ncbi:MAG: hypothetical protein IJ705_07570 [Oscillospiraceae bacterium]|nr:hypothetical protein [Oscillospiraceae bacterium]
MDKIPEIGDPVSFVPYAFVEHQDRRSSDRINGRIVYVNHAHRWYLAQGPCDGGLVREAFKF